MRRAVVGIAIATLSFGPWLGLLGAIGVGDTPALFADPLAYRQATSSTQGEPPGVLRRRLASSCICREVVVNATNVVRDAEIESGDAEVKNSLVTYIAQGFKGELEIDQEAEARSGDAIAGQILAVDAGEGCARVSVRARNHVEDAEVESGDAVAKNRSVVLFDPAVDREEVELDIDQDAEATTGVAMAGQVIGVRGGGGPCGGVDIDALNDVIDVDLETGEAITDNDSIIEDCDAECLEELEEALDDAEAVQVCGEDGCKVMSRDEFLEYMGVATDSGRPDGKGPPPAPETVEEQPAESPTPGPSEVGDDAEPTATPAPTSTPMPPAEGSEQLAAGG